MKLSLIILFSFAIFYSCTKRQNRKSIEGNWTLIKFNGTYYNIGSNPLEGTFTFDHKQKKCFYSWDVLMQQYDSLGVPSGIDTIHQVGEWAYEVGKSTIILNEQKWDIDLLTSDNFNISKTSGGNNMFFPVNNQLMKFRRH